MNPTAPFSPRPTPSQPPTARPRIIWLVFWCVLLAPAFLSVVVQTIKKEEFGAAPYALIGSGIAAVICGAILAWGPERSVAVQISFTVCYAIGLFFVSFFLCIVGCSLVG